MTHGLGPCPCSAALGNALPVKHPKLEKNPQWRNICEIIMKIVTYCGKIIKIDEKKTFQKTRKTMFYAFLFRHLESRFEQPNHFPDEQIR